MGLRSSKLLGIHVFTKDFYLTALKGPKKQMGSSERQRTIITPKTTSITRLMIFDCTPADLS